MKTISESDIEWLVSNTKSILREIEKEFCYWLRTIFQKEYGKEYWSSIKTSLNKTDDEKRNFDSWKKITDLDLFMLLKLAERKFQVLQKNANISKDFKSVIIQTKNVRHKIEGHQPIEGPSIDELEEYLVTLKRFSTYINLPDHLFKKIEDMKNRTSQLVLVEKGLIPYPGTNDNINSDLRPLNKDDEKFNKSFEKFLSGTELTESQRETVCKLDEFFREDSKQCFILKGYAGTGKTFLIGLLVEYLNYCKINSRILAPTGRAARVIAENYNINAGTIHRNIYYSKELKQYESKDEYGKVTYKWYFSLLNNDSEQGTIFIVDESSMISDVYSENEFIRFGSGKLLTDLLKYVNFDGNDNKKKIIFVGDDAQLPPIDMNESPALDELYISKSFNLEIISSQLVDVLRQKQNSKILELAKSFRNSIDNNIQNNFKFINDDKEIIKLEHVDFIPRYFDVTEKKIDNTSIIITYTNSSAADYNKIIREKLFEDPSLIQKDDQIIVVKNNYSSLIDIMNGQMGFVQSVSPFAERHSVPLNKGKKAEGGRDVIYVDLIFRQLEIKFMDTNGSEHILPFMVLENLLDNPQAGITSDESKAQYVFFKQRYPQLRPGSIDFKKAIQTDKYFNALHIKFGYAITCHKAQGGSWANVFIDFAERNTLSADVLRWGYTAVTRSEEKIYLTNTKDHSLLRPIDMSSDDLLEIGDEPEFLPSEPDGSIQSAHILDLPENFSGDEIFMRKMFHAVYKLLPVGSQLIENIHRPNLEQYKFLYETNRLIIKLHYKKDYKLSNIQCQNFPDDLEDILDKIYGLKGRIFTNSELLENQKIIESFSEDCNYPVLKEIFDRYKEYGMIITPHKISNYHYSIEVQFDDASEIFNYYLDKKQRLKKIIPQSEFYNKVIFNRLLRIHLSK
jgi:hypothetical protein